MESGEIRILVVDDEMVVRDSLASWFEEEGYEVGTAASGKEALQRMQEGSWDIGLLDIKMPGMDGLELQRKMKEIDPAVQIIIMTAYASVQTAVDALKDGAYDYIVKPFDPDQLVHIIRNATEHKKLSADSERLRRKVDEETEEQTVIGESAQMRRVMELVRQVARTDSTVLILGESGTGKELIARAIHNHSPRRYMPIVTVNCGALPEGILESELFGHEKGAFTGAQYKRKGKFELADGGTIFLDEISDISSKTQSDLLRVLEEKKITRVGGNREIVVDFRVIAATNRDLAGSVKEGRFRQDLYYRLNVFSIELAPLRERPEDILPIARHFLKKFNLAMGRQVKGFTPDTERKLIAHDWPGNVRELENAIERAYVVSEADLIGAYCLPFSDEAGISGNKVESLTEVEKKHIEKALLKTGWNISRAAKLLEIDRVTLYNKIKKFDLQRPE
ncbi:MAG TPA: sigma-54 dependent transcriptional regulator [Acidobacteriota bacterium]|nr:sigma-54 dependent transcriptional regulator [Acidobacteriota bacterium]